MLVGLRVEGVLGCRRVEVDLDHLPVALVQVVPVVEGVEVPVLQRQTTGGIGLRHDVRVGDGRLPGGHPPRPVHVPAAGIEGIAWEVEVVVVEAAGEILPGRRDLDEVATTPRPAQRDRGVSEQRVDVHRQIGLARPAVVIRRDAEDGRVALRQSGLVGEAGRRGRSPDEAEQRQSKRSRQRDAPPHAYLRALKPADDVRPRTRRPSA